VNRLKSIIIYTSKTGYTKQYAQMLSQSLQCPLISRKELASVKLGDYDRIIYGGGIRATKICGLRSMLSRFRTLSDKEIIIFAVGATSKSPEYRDDLKHKNLTEQNLDYPFFYFQGGFDPDRLSYFMRYMLRKVKKSILKKQAKNPDSLDQGDKDFLDFFHTPHSNVDKGNLEEMLDFINLST
jgi:menaquinone-dependent protoporphyrinogen IX oxidase